MSANIIDITDLAQPILTDIQRQIRDAADADPVVLTEETVLQGAGQATGLSDFGEQDFRERLRRMIAAIDKDAGMSQVRRTDLFHLFVRHASARLRLEDLISRHPEILAIDIDRPIIVTGLPRSGTTHLIGLLSADQRFRSLPWWEAVAPFPGPDDAPGNGDANPRWTRAADGWKQFDAILPHMKIMHGFDPDHISEDIELQALDFSSYLIEWYAHVPEWRDYYLSHDQSGTYAYLKKAMQALTFLRGSNRWVIKCPQHMEQLPALKKVFPDGVFVLTHRDPVASIQSAITMTSYFDRVFREEVNVELRARYWIDRYETLLRRCVDDRDVLPAEQSLDLYFHEWIGNPYPALEKIYRMADLPLTASALADFEGYLSSNHDGQHGKMIYNLRRDCGRSPEEIRERFSFYIRRFPVAIEVRSCPRQSATPDPTRHLPPVTDRAR